MASIPLTEEDLARIGAQALAQVDEAVGIITTDLRYAWVNPEFCRLTGFPPEEIVGQPVTALRSGLHDAAFYDAMLASVRDDGLWQGEVWRRKKTGEAFPALLTISAIHDASTDTRYYIDLFIDLDRVRAGRDSLEFGVNHDALTELPNRRLFWDRLDLVMKRAQRHDVTVSLVFVDIDNFKRVNDTHGHPYGDRLLIGIANALQGCLREADTIARVGGDEFVVLIEDHDAHNESSDVAERIRAALDAVWADVPGDLSLGASLGVATFPGDGHDAETLYAAADRAMYAEKQHQGRRARPREDR